MKKEIVSEGKLKKHLAQEEAQHKKDMQAEKSEVLKLHQQIDENKKNFDKEMKVVVLKKD